MRFPEWRFASRQGPTLLLAIGLAVNGLGAWFVTLPGYVDAYYYFDGALQLARGQGFSEPYLWNYLAPRSAADDARARWPSHLYWMPLASMVAAPFIAAAEAGAGRQLSNAVLFRAAQVPFVLLASLFPLVTFAAARAVTGQPRHAWTAALLTLFSAYYFAHWPVTDSFALFGCTAGGAMLAAALAEGRRLASWWRVLSGLLAGLAHLTRADGVLVVAVLAAWIAWRARAPSGRPGLAPAARALLPLLSGYGLVMGPWFARNLALFGAPLAPGGLRTLWLVSYDDLFTFYPERLTPANYLAAGWTAMAAGKAAALSANLATLVGVQANVVAVPFVLAGAWRLRRAPLIQLGWIYGLALFALMTLVFTFPGARGGYFHSGAALLPFLLTAAAAGLDTAVESAARRLRHWQPERSRPVFAALLVALVAALAGGVYSLRVIGPGWPPAWSRRDAVYAEAGEVVRTSGEAQAADPPTVVAVNNPPGWYYFTGLPAVVIPNGDAAMLRDAMAATTARWLVLDANRPAALADLYTNPGSVDWLRLRSTLIDGVGRPVYIFEWTDAAR